MVAKNGKGAPGKAQRSRITNRPDLWPQHQTPAALARRRKDFFDGIVKERGGLDKMSQSHIEVARRAASLVVLTETMEASYFAGEGIDHDSYLRACGSLLRHMDALGVLAPPDHELPTLESYLAGQA